MALDRFVYWKKEKPTPQQIEFVVEDFFSGIATTIEWIKDRWYVTLPGTPSDPLKRIDGIKEFRRKEFPEERWIEVWVSPEGECVDIMTRSTDSITNSIANGLESVFSNFF